MPFGRAHRCPAQGQPPAVPVIPAARQIDVRAAPALEYLQRDLDIVGELVDSLVEVRMVREVVPSPVSIESLGGRVADGLDGQRGNVSRDVGVGCRRVDVDLGERRRRGPGLEMLHVLDRPVEVELLALHLHLRQLRLIEFAPLQGEGKVPMRFQTPRATATTILCFLSVGSDSTFAFFRG